jgi:hypothetical protein
MQDHGDRRLRPQDRRDVGVGLPGVDDCGLAGITRQLELPLKHGALNGTGGMVVVVVEADLAAGHDPRIAEHSAQPASRVIGPGAGIVGMHAGSGGDAGIPGRQLQPQRRRGLGLADHDEVPDPAGPRPRDHLGAIGREGLIAEVAVRVDKHGLRRPVEPSSRRAAQCPSRHDTAPAAVLDP